MQEDPISCLALDDTTVYAGVHNSVRVFRRGKERRRWEGHGGCVHTLLLLGTKLVVVDESNCLRVWDTRRRGDLVRELQTCGLS